MQIPQKSNVTEQTQIDSKQQSFLYSISVLLRTLGAQFSIEDGDDSEKVTLKINSRFSSLCRVYSSPLKMSNVSEFL